ncbi:MAG: glycogen synthase [Fimbriimonadaceae bacterium]|nr:glycogen synthase [Fimbriimonadaceae bacterium]
MRVLFVTAELAPFAKVGGLADVAHGLPKALAAHGVDVRVILPGYEYIESISKPTAEFEVSVNPHHRTIANLREVEGCPVPTYTIAGDGLYAAVSSPEELYSPGRDAYLFLARALPQACHALHWRPDVIHANDWHTGFVPVVLREGGEDWSDVATVFTIHNLGYQGAFGPDTLESVGLPYSLFNFHQVEAWGCVNFLKAGVAFSDRTNTVSPTYAREIQTPEFGFGLDGHMRHLAEHGRLSGILNGIDTETHDPATDPVLDANFSVGDLAGKARGKICLLAEQGMADGPLLSVVSRLSEQKGFDLLLSVIPQIVAAGGSLVVLGVGSPEIASSLRKAEAAAPKQVRFVNRYDAELGQRIYASSDGFLMPSAYEPCGLGQMFAMRYGTLPVVRNTGGLADSVTDGVDGFVFEGRSQEAFSQAVGRALAVYDTPERQRMIQAAMTKDFSWDARAQEYVELYRRSRRTVPVE